MDEMTGPRRRHRPFARRTAVHARGRRASWASRCSAARRSTSAKGEWLVNPGSVGQPRDGDPRAAWMLLDSETGRPNGAESPMTSRRRRRHRGGGTSRAPGCQASPRTVTRATDDKSPFSPAPARRAGGGRLRFHDGGEGPGVPAATAAEIGRRWIRSPAPGRRRDPAHARTPRSRTSPRSRSRFGQLARGHRSGGPLGAHGEHRKLSTLLDDGARRSPRRRTRSSRTRHDRGAARDRDPARNGAGDDAADDADDARREREQRQRQRERQGQGRRRTTGGGIITPGGDGSGGVVSPD